VDMPCPPPGRGKPEELSCAGLAFRYHKQVCWGGVGVARLLRVALCVRSPGARNANGGVGGFET